MLIQSNELLNQLFQSLKSLPSESLESETVEFKNYRDVNSLFNSKDVAEEISALSNLEGGVIIIGVVDSSNIRNGAWETQLNGFDLIDLSSVSERLKGKINPKINIKVENFPFESKNYVVIHIPASKNSIVSTSSGKLYIRDGKSSRPMEPVEIERHVKALQGYDWSSEDLYDCNREAFDQDDLNEALQDFTKRRNIVDDIDISGFLESIGATKNGIITKGGLLFLGKDVQIKESLGLFEYRFSWKRKDGELLVNDVWTGNVWSAIKRFKMHFNYCNKESIITFKNKEYKIPTLDKVAFHEAILNALVHRDYSQEGMISVNFTGDEIIITSPGGFYGGVNSENIGQHEPRHRNKALAKILMDHKLVDRAGMGVIRMGLRSLTYGRSFPTFSEILNTVEVRMDVEYLRPGIFVLTSTSVDKYGIPELLILNSVYDIGYILVSQIERFLIKFSNNPWNLIQKSIEKLEQVELCGDKDGVYVRVSLSWISFFGTARFYKAPTNSEKFVKLYKYLKHFKQGTNKDIQTELGYHHKAQTSKFLTKTKFIKKTGKNVNTRWQLSL